MKAHDGMYIDGAWRPAVGSDLIEVVNPADGQVIAQVPAGTEEDVDAAVRAARAALPGWAATAPAERAALIGALRDALLARTGELTETITAELGSPLGFSKAVHVGAPIAVATSYAELASSYAFEERVGNSTVLLEPIGVVAAITPWNYPLHQVVAKVAPALAAGCTLVLKPAEDTPLTAQLFAEAVHEAGIPAGVFNLVTGTGPVAGQALAAHEESTSSPSPARPRSASRSARRPAPPSSGSRSNWAANRPMSSCPGPTWSRPSGRASGTS